MDINLNSDTHFPLNIFNEISKLGVNPIIIVISLVVIVLYIILFGALGSGFESKNLLVVAPKDSGDVNVLEIILWSVLILLVLLNGLQYFFGVNIVASLQNLFKDSELDIAVEYPEPPLPGGGGDNSGGDDPGSGSGGRGGDGDDPDEPTLPPVLPEITSAPQVFHVPNNKYTYENAEAVCTAYGGRLANYKDMEKAYNQGADWCGYGWSANQMALYPTQFKKWKQMQKIAGHQHDCGRPGINGGYIANPNVRFGVNCFGYKPTINSEEAEQMVTAPLYPRSREELEFEKRVDYWRKKIPNILLSPFNHNNWSII